MQTVADALDFAGIKALQLKGTSHQKSNGLEAFQRESFEEVIMPRRYVLDAPCLTQSPDEAPSELLHSYFALQGDPKVLLLNVRDESASGANLTTANHAFFVHPLLVNSDQEYHACLTQAMGRVVRSAPQPSVAMSWPFCSHGLSMCALLLPSQVGFCPFVRFGQTKKVNIRHFLAAESIDTEIHAERHPKGVAV